MQINLRCSDSLMKIVSAVIEAHGLKISPEANITLLEKGHALPEQGIAVVFDPQSLGDLADFLELLSSKTEGRKPIIAGRQVDSESYEIVNLDDIYYFEAEGNFTNCITANSKLRVKSKLYELEVTLLQKGFIRISKSQVVNIMHVAEISPWFNSRLLLKLKDNREIEVSRNFVKNFKEFLEL